MPKSPATQPFYDELLQAFEKLYPDPRSELNFSNEYELVVSVLLSAQCTDKKVNEVTPILFKECPNFKKLSGITPKKLESIIRPINYYKTKAKNLIALSKQVCSTHNAKVPRTFQELTDLPGIGRKSANVVLNELGISHALPVDTHVFRVSQRLELAKGKTPEEIEEQLKLKFNPEFWRPLHHWLILHGRRVCKAQRPLCAQCELNKICPSSNIKY